MRDANGAVLRSCEHTLVGGVLGAASGLCGEGLARMGTCYEAARAIEIELRAVVCGDALGSRGRAVTRETSGRHH
jgi:hypothetical protein